MISYLSSPRKSPTGNHPKSTRLDYRVSSVECDGVYFTVVLIMNIYFLLRIEPVQKGSGNSAGSLDRLSATPTRKGNCSGE